MSPIIRNLNTIVQEVPAMPVVAQQVMQMLNDPLTTNAMLGETLSMDQSIAARVLQMANSPFFGLRKKVASISNAIFVLGHSMLNSVVLTACTKNLFRKPGVMEKKIWEHALGTAVAARLLAERTGLQDHNEAFIGGLLHDIGRTSLLAVYPDEYRPQFMEFLHERGKMTDLIAVEKQEFGYDHCEIGALVLAKWNLPKVYARVALLHHTDMLEVLDLEEDPGAIALAGQANLVAARLGLGRKEPDEHLEVISTPFNDILNLDRDDMFKILRKTAENYKASQDQFKL